MNAPASLSLPSGHQLPALGLGTWRMGESRARRNHELAALRSALDMGYRLFDTAEMYAEGGAEDLLGEALAQAMRGSVAREQLFVVTKVYPHNASARGVLAACERSRRRLQLEHVDLYLLHWRGGTDLDETVAAFEALREQGKILRWGVSNFDVDDMEEIAALPDGAACMTDQVLYNPEARGIEFDLLPWCADKHVPVMAYSPVGQGGRLLRSAALKAVAGRHGATAAQVALAWAMRHPHVIAIPKAADADHVRQNAAAAALALTDADFAEIDAAFPPPRRKQSLEML